MSVTSEKTGLSLTQEILSHLGLANKVGAARTVGIIFTLSSQGVRGLGTGKRRAGPEAMLRAQLGHWRGHGQTCDASLLL